MTAKIEGPDNIRNRIVAYVPERLLVFRNEHAPKGISFGAKRSAKFELPSNCRI